jgi:hypothetical protein
LVHAGRDHRGRRQVSHPFGRGGGRVGCEIPVLRYCIRGQALRRLARVRPGVRSDLGSGQPTAGHWFRAYLADRFALAARPRHDAPAATIHLPSWIPRPAPGRPRAFVVDPPPTREWCPVRWPANSSSRGTNQGSPPDGTATPTPATPPRPGPAHDHAPGAGVIRSGPSNSGTVPIPKLDGHGAWVRSLCGSVPARDHSLVS